MLSNKNTIQNRSVAYVCDNFEALVCEMKQNHRLASESEHYGSITYPNVLDDSYRLCLGWSDELFIGYTVDTGIQTESCGTRIVPIDNTNDRMWKQLN